jgi:hypothetical protein
MSSMSSFRGGYAPRRGRGGWTKPFVKPKKEIAKPDINKHPLGELLESLSISDLRVNRKAASKDETISNLRYVASYNWRGDASTTIIVPGKMVS